MKHLALFLALSLLLCACGNAPAETPPTETRDPFYVESVTPVKAKSLAEIYFPKTGIVNPPVVVQTIGSRTGFPDRDRSPAVCILSIDKDMNVVEGDKVLTTVETFMALNRDRVIPAFRIDSQEEADALLAYLKAEKIIDAYAICSSEQAGLLYQLRTGYGHIQGALWFDSIPDENARREALLLANRSLAAVICTDQPMTMEDTAYFNTRMVSLWAPAADEAGVYHAIASGYNGILCTDTDTVFDVYESMTAITVCGKSIVVGHRGFSDYLENTISSFKMAVEQYGCPALELDLRLSSDGEIVIMHDKTLDRTTNSAGNVAEIPLEILKTVQVTKGGNGDTDSIPTFEEVLQAFRGTGVVLTCHINVVNERMAERFAQLVEQYGCQDQVIAFIGSANIDKYNYTNYAESISFAAGDNESYLLSADPLGALYMFTNTLIPLHYQPLFYDYISEDSDHSDPEFYYMMCARGFLNWHSITNGQLKVEEALLTGNGAAAILTDDAHLAANFFYGIDAKAQTLKPGEKLPLKQTAIGQVADKAVDCGYIQLSGPTLSGDTLDSAGTVTVVYYAELRTDGLTTYQIYSPPVEITFE